jgi:hypothetical protein
VVALCALLTLSCLICCYKLASIIAPFDCLTTALHLLSSGCSRVVDDHELHCCYNNFQIAHQFSPNLVAPTTCQLLQPRYCACRLTPAERKALADKAREEKRLQLKAQEVRMQLLRASKPLTAILQRWKAEIHQRWAEQKAQAEAAARVAEAAAARAAGGAAASAEDIWLPDEAYEVWGVTAGDEAACIMVRKLYAVTQLGRYGTDCLRAAYKVGRDLAALEQSGVLSQVTCPVCRMAASQQQQQQEEGAGQQQQQQQAGAGAGAGAAGLSAAAESFIPHKFDGDRHSKSAEAYQVGAWLTRLCSCKQAWQLHHAAT